MRTFLWLIIVGTAAVLSIVACARVGKHGGLVQTVDTDRCLRGSYEPATTAPSQMAARNMQALADYRHVEVSFYHPPRDPEGRPQHCLALSGGGVRAATYSIGVLQGLAEKDRLRSLDIISGVSGGAYALSWYYLQQWEEQRPENESPNGFPLYGKKRVLENSDTWWPIALRQVLAFIPALLLRTFANVTGNIGVFLSGESSIKRSHPTWYAETLAKIYHNSASQKTIQV